MSMYEVEVQGESPLLMNRFTEEAAAKVSAGSTVLTIAGSRGTPREQAENKLYRSADGAPMIPGPNIFRGLIDAGVFQKIGRRALTTGRASIIPAGIQLIELECKVVNPFNIGGEVIWEVDSRSVVNPATGGRMMCYQENGIVWALTVLALQCGDRR